VNIAGTRVAVVTAPLPIPYLWRWWEKLLDFKDLKTWSRPRGRTWRGECEHRGAPPPAASRRATAGPADDRCQPAPAGL